MGLQRFGCDDNHRTREGGMGLQRFGCDDNHRIH